MNNSFEAVEKQFFTHTWIW